MLTGNDVAIALVIAIFIKSHKVDLDVVFPAPFWKIILVTRLTPSHFRKWSAPPKRVNSHTEAFKLPRARLMKVRFPNHLGSGLGNLTTRDSLSPALVLLVLTAHLMLAIWLWKFSVLWKVVGRHSHLWLSLDRFHRWLWFSYVSANYPPDSRAQIPLKMNQFKKTLAVVRVRVVIVVVCSPQLL